MHPDPIFQHPDDGNDKAINRWFWAGIVILAVCAFLIWKN